MASIVERLDHWVALPDRRRCGVRQIHEFKQHEGAIRSMDFHPHELLLVSGSQDRTVRLRSHPPHESHSHLSPRRSSSQPPLTPPDEGGTATKKLRIGLLRFGTGRQKMGRKRGTTPTLSRFTRRPRTGYNRVEENSAGVANRPRELISNSPIRHFCIALQAKLWDLESFEMVASYVDSTPVQAVTFDADGNHVITATQDHVKVLAWEPNQTVDYVDVG